MEVVEVSSYLPGWLALLRAMAGSGRQRGRRLRLDSSGRVPLEAATGRTFRTMYVVRGAAPPQTGRVRLRVGSREAVYRPFRGGANTPPGGRRGALHQGLGHRGGPGLLLISPGLCFNSALLLLLFESSQIPDELPVFSPKCLVLLRYLLESRKKGTS